MARKKRELSGETVVSANIYRGTVEPRRWAWQVVTKEHTHSGGGYDTPLAAARSLVNELEKHSDEF